jgi:hypothetical protein
VNAIIASKKRLLPMSTSVSQGVAKIWRTRLGFGISAYGACGGAPEILWAMAYFLKAGML